MLAADDVLASICKRKEACWKMAEVFLQNLDAHGIMDMGAEIQALNRAEEEIKKLQ